MSGETDVVANGSFLARQDGGCVDVGEEKQVDQVRYTLGRGMNQICGLIEFVKGGICVCARTHAHMHTNNSQFLTWGLNSDIESTEGGAGLVRRGRRLTVGGCE